MYQRGEVLSSSITCQVMLRINMLAFRVPSYCCGPAFFWGWGLFRLLARAFFSFFPRCAAPLSFRRVPCSFLPPGSVFLLPRVPCFPSALSPSAGVVVVPLPRAPRLCWVRLGGGSTGCRRASFCPLFFFFSSPGRPKAKRGAKGKQRRPGPRPRLASPRQGLSPRLFFSSPGAAPRARARVLFLPRLSAASCLAVTRDLTRPAPCAFLVGADGEWPRRQTRRRHAMTTTDTPTDTDRSFRETLVASWLSAEVHKHGFAFLVRQEAGHGDNLNPGVRVIEPLTDTVFTIGVDFHDVTRGGQKVTRRNKILVGQDFFGTDRMGIAYAAHHATR